MKNILVLSLLGAASLLASCGGKGKGVKFNPDMTESSQMGVPEEKSHLLALSPDSMIAFDGLKFSVLPPTLSSDIPVGAAERLTSRLITIAGSNGVGGLCVNPVLGIASKVDCMERGVTGTAPQKTIAKYEIIIYCGNFVSNEIYSSSSVSVTGVGSSFESAALNAMNQIKQSREIEEMFRDATQKAMEWYNAPGNIDRFVDNALANQNYALAMAILESVPINVNVAIYENALRRNREVSDAFFQSKASQLFSSMQAAIAASNGTYNPEAGAYFCLIPSNSNVYPEARRLFETYAEKIDVERKDNIKHDWGVADTEAAYAQQIALATLDNERYKETLDFEIQKIKAPYEAQATIAQIEADGKVAAAKASNTGGFLGLGHLWQGGFEIINRVMDKFENSDWND